MRTIGIPGFKQKGISDLLTDASVAPWFLFFLEGVAAPLKMVFPKKGSIFSQAH